MLSFLIALLALSASATEAEAQAALTAMADRDRAARDKLGLPATSTAAEVAGKIVAIEARAAVGDVTIREMHWTPGVPADAETQIVRTLKHSGFVSFEEHTRVLREAGAREQALTDEQLLDQARVEGKLTPAMEPWFKAALKRDPEGARTWLTAAPKVAPATGRPAGDPPPVTAGRLTDSQRQICRQLGITEQQYSDQLRAERGARV